MYTREQIKNQIKDIDEVISFQKNIISDDNVIDYDQCSIMCDSEFSAETIKEGYMQASKDARIILTSLIESKKLRIDYLNGLSRSPL